MSRNIKKNSILSQRVFYRTLRAWPLVLYLFFTATSTYAKMPKELEAYVSRLYFGTIRKYKPEVGFSLEKKGLVHVTVDWSIQDSTWQDDVQVQLTPAFNPTFHWTPHLTPTDSNIVAQHVFRCPALIAADHQKQLVLIPDLDLLKSAYASGQILPEWYLDMDAPRNYMVLGLSLSTIREHVLFYKGKGGVYPPGKRRIGFYLLFTENSGGIADPWQTVLSFYWEKWGLPLYKKGEPLQGKSLQQYATQTYQWAFGFWKKNTWQDLLIRGKEVGAPTFIVNVTQSPNWKGIINEREERSIWNQAWFNSFRSAMGLFRYARETGNDSLLRYARKTKELALAFPQVDGFFYSVIATGMDTFSVKGKMYHRSKGWNNYYFGNSNRNPFTWDIRQSPYHVLDMSYTAYLMLCWYEELERDPRLLQYAMRYADGLVRIQEKNGFFPAWLSLDTHMPMGYLDTSPETSMSVTFLLKLYRTTGNGLYKKAAIKALRSVMDSIIVQGKWEDFETYWSCSRYGADSLVGKKIVRNDVYKQNTLSMYYTAQALYYAYETTKEQRFLKYGRRTLDEMLMYQATWQPPYMYVNVVGGFGVMNGDAEWNDARQSLFAELILQYGTLLHQSMYIQRGIAALKASFVMMYAPFNPRTKKQWEKRWPFFGKKDYGFMMENYGHDGTTFPDGRGIGEFTIYDWGNGAASEAYFRIREHYGTKWLSEHLY